MKFGHKNSTISLMVALVWIGFTLCVFLIGLSPLRDTDTFLYLAMAREVLQHGITPYDPFVPMPNFPWVIHHEWGGHMLYYLSYLIGGYTGVIVLKIAAYLAAMAPAWYWLKKKNLWGRPEYFVLFWLALLAMSLRFSERTAVFGDLYLVILLSLVVLDLEKVKWARWGFPILTILWVNTHGSWPLVFIFTGWWAITQIQFDDLREGFYRSGIAALCLLASFVNPLGPKGTFFPFELLGGSQDFLRENIAEFLPTFGSKMIQHPQVWVFGMFLLMTGFIIFREVRHQGLNRRTFCLVTMAGALYIQSFMAVRFIATDCLGLLLLVSGIALPARAEAKDTHNDSWWSAAKALALPQLTLIVLLVGLIFSGKFERDNMLHKIGIGVDDRMFPTETVKALKALPVRGPTLNSYFYGGLLAWELNGKRKIFVHGFFSDMDFLQKEFLILGHGRKAIDHLTKKYQFDSILIETTKLYAPVIEGLVNHPDWYLAVLDKTAALYVRRSVPQKPRF